MARLKDKVQNALDEARLLILGTQVLLGLQYRAAFEQGFAKLPVRSQYLNLTALCLLLIALALLVWPGAFHRIVARGEDTETVHEFTTQITEWALIPFGIGLSLNVFVAAEKILGPLAGLGFGLGAILVAFTFWYGIEALEKKKHRSEGRGVDHEDGGTKLRDKIEHVLTETRVVLPGAQALLGFQFITILTDAFDNLPSSSKYVHLISLMMIAASIILLMTPAAYHRIVERGEETEHFHEFAGRILIAAMVPLALGVCGDFYVVAAKITDSNMLSAAAALAMLVLFYGFWFVLTAYWRNGRKKKIRLSAKSDVRQSAREQSG